MNKFTDDGRKVMAKNRRKVIDIPILLHILTTGGKIFSGSYIPIKAMTPKSPNVITNIFQLSKKKKYLYGCQQKNCFI